jgi:hypothetical protein
VADVVAGEAPDMGGGHQRLRHSTADHRSRGVTTKDEIGYIGAMLSWLKLVTLCLLAFALPVQGWAAAAMVHCERSRQHNEGVVHVHETGETHQHLQAVVVDDALEHAVAGSVASDSHSPSTSSKPGKLAHVGDHSCSACGACCSPAAMPTMAIDVADPAPPARWIAVVTYGRVGFVTSGPDRPPRLILA